MVSLFGIIVGNYPDNLNTIVVSQDSGSVSMEVVRKGSGNIFKGVYIKAVLVY